MLILNKIINSKRLRTLDPSVVECPGTPRNFHVFDISSDSITLAWEASPSDGTDNVLQYLIEMKSVEDSDFALIGKVIGTCTYTCDFLKKGRKYQFRVRGKNSAGTSPIPAQLTDYVSLFEGPGKW